MKLAVKGLARGRTSGAGAQTPDFLIGNADPKVLSLEMLGMAKPMAPVRRLVFFYKLYVLLTVGQVTR